MSLAPVKAVSTFLRGHQFLFSTEDQLQRGIEQAFVDAGIPFAREVRLSVRDRIDFVVGKVGIEVKIDQPASQVIRQLHRYAQCPLLDSFVLVTTRCSHMQVPQQLNAKPIEVVFVSLGALLDANLR